MTIQVTAYGHFFFAMYNENVITSSNVELLLV